MFVVVLSACGRSNFNLHGQNGDSSDAAVDVRGIDASSDAGPGGTDARTDGTSGTSFDAAANDALSADVYLLDGSEALDVSADAQRDASGEPTDTLTSDTSTNESPDSSSSVDAQLGDASSDSASTAIDASAPPPDAAPDSASPDVAPPPCTVGDPCTIECGQGTLDGACVCQITGPRPNGTACRVRAGDCDLDDACDGSSLLCFDQLVVAGTMCDPARGVCDPADRCDGLSRRCPQSFASTAVACADEPNMCTDDHCDGAGACVHVPNTAPCDDGDVCSDPDRCNSGICQGTATGDPCSDRCTYCAPRIGCQVRPTACISCLGNEGLSCGVGHTLTCTAGICQ